MKYVFFLNMGGVNKLEECEVFLDNMFNDPNILTIKSNFLRKAIAFIIKKSRLKTMQENYKKIGSKSPLTDIQTSLCNKLNSMQNEYHFDFCSTYVPPFTKDVLQKYNFLDNDEIILFPLYPHYSTTTTKSSLEDFYKHFKGNLNIKVIDYFYKDIQYNNIIFNEIKKQKKADVLIVSAHSLPKKIIDLGDVYEEHIKEHFKIIQEHFKDEFSTILLAYQSKLGPVKWLEPSLKATLEELNETKKSVLIYPISFCIDCSETVLELSIEYKNEFKNELNVCECLNDKDEFCEYILNKLKS